MRILRVDNGVQWISCLFQSLVKYLGCDLRISSTSYPESNGLVEQAIKNIKVALTAKLDRQQWLFYLATIILSLNTLCRAEVGCSPDDLMFFQGLRLPGNLVITPPLSQLLLIQDIIFQMKKFAASLKPTPTCVHQTRPVYLPSELKTHKQVFVKIHPIKLNLVPAYSGPYLIVFKTKKTFDILQSDKV